MELLQMNTPTAPDHSALPITPPAPDQYTRSFRCSVPLDASTPDQYTRSFCYSVGWNYSRSIHHQLQIIPLSIEPIYAVLLLQINTPDHSATPLDGITPDKYTRSLRCWSVPLLLYWMQSLQMNTPPAPDQYTRSFCCCSVPLLLCWMPVLQINTPDHSAAGRLNASTPDEYTSSRSFCCCSVRLLLCWMPVLQINTPDHSAAGRLNAITPDEYTSSSSFCYSVGCNYSR